MFNEPIHHDEYCKRKYAGNQQLPPVHLYFVPKRLPHCGQTETKDEEEKIIDHCKPIVGEIVGDRKEFLHDGIGEIKGQKHPK